MEKEQGLKAKIMIIDCDVVMMDILTEILGKYGHRVYSYTEPVSAIEALKSDSFDILIVNYLMSPVNGDRIIEIVREFNKNLYIILMSNRKDLEPTINTMIDLDIQAYFEKSAHVNQLILLIQSGIKYTEQLKNIESMSRNMEKNITDFAKILTRALSAKNNETGNHSERVAEICVLFGNYIGLGKEELESLRLGALFHDIGKVGLPDNILTKDGKLTDMEYEAIKLNTVIGSSIVGLAEFLKNSVPVIRSHHENWNGTGYPDGLKGEEIPLLARVLHICNYFDALTNKKANKAAMTFKDALHSIKKDSRTSFDPELIIKFEHFIDENEEKVLEIKSRVQ